ncbi:bifunctional 3,4-dihydroxy-2-butanone 4-phosphate synthase/GTP cyclohydrolase II-like protein [compost metagenome]
MLDLLEVKSTTHSWSIPAAMQAIDQADSGVIVLLNCGDTVEQLFTQFTALDAPQTRPRRKPDLRTYGMGAQILKDVGVGKMRVLAARQRMPSMTGFDLEVTGYQPMNGQAE